jgi:antitoxin component of MazEF toxin-antitoxin module
MNTGNKLNESKVIHVTVATEPMARGVVKTWGNSLAMRIPAEVAKKYKFADGVEIEFLPSEFGFLVKPHVYPVADDQEGLRAFYLSLVAQVTTDMEGYEEEEALWEPMGDEID